MKDRENKNMSAAYKEVYNKLEANGHRPQLHILDNECSKCIQNYLEAKGTKRHHVAPHSHRVKIARQNSKISFHCGAGNARLGLPHSTVEQNAETSSGHAQHVQNINK